MTPAFIEGVCPSGRAPVGRLGPCGPLRGSPGGAPVGRSAGAEPFILRAPGRGRGHFSATCRPEERCRPFFTGPHGYFTFRDFRLKPVFVATGTGIAPFVSMVRAGAKGFIVLHGVSTGGGSMLSGRVCRVCWILYSVFVRRQKRTSRGFFRYGHGIFGKRTPERHL